MTNLVKFSKISDSDISLSEKKTFFVGGGINVIEQRIMIVLTNLCHEIVSYLMCKMSLKVFLSSM